MKLSPIKKEHIEEAARAVSYNGVPKNQLSNLHWVVVDGKEFPFKHLVRVAYQFATGQREWLAFQTNRSYLNYVERLGFKLEYHKEGYNFFELDEINLFSTVAGNKYRTENDENFRIGELLRPFARKVDKWAELSCIGDFHHDKDGRWQQSGVFMPYLWTRIRGYQTSSQVYFIVGCRESGELFINLDCQRSNRQRVKAVPADRQASFDKHLLESDYAEIVIPLPELKEYNWDKLIHKTQEFIKQHTGLYHELLSIVNEGQTFVSPNSISETSLEEETAPIETKSYAGRKRSFKGREVNWDYKTAISNKLGYDGEQLAIKHEQKKLREIGLVDKALAVAKQKDGVGYDVLSFNEEGDEIHIEVKTTTSGKDEPFFMSRHEYEFVKEFPENYFLYRVYNFQSATGKGKFYRLTGEELLKVKFSPIGFEVSI